jgi:glyoxylase-like metal-dependent hydrolase (beta-lactamase superfamily II)
MAKSIRTLASWMVNAYLVKTNTGYILIDTGFRFDRKRLDRALSDTGCRPGDLKLIVITHGNGVGVCREKHRSP